MGPFWSVQAHVLCACISLRIIVKEKRSDHQADQRAFGICSEPAFELRFNNPASPCSSVFKKQKVHKCVFPSVTWSLQIPLQLLSNSWHSCRRETKPTVKENNLAGKSCWLGGGGELGTQCFQECHTLRW